jgi:hypothetical protein
VRDGFTGLSEVAAELIANGKSVVDVKVESHGTLPLSAQHKAPAIKRFDIRQVLVTESESSRRRIFFELDFDQIIIRESRVDVAGVASKRINR